MDTIRHCHYCRTPLHTVPANETHVGPPFGRVWVDDTDGDVCSGDDNLVNENLPHVPAHVWVVIVTTTVNPEDDGTTSIGDDPINFLSVYGTLDDAKASAKEQFDDLIAENDDFDDGDDWGMETSSKNWSHRDGVTYTVTDSFSIHRIEVIRRDVETVGVAPVPGVDYEVSGCPMCGGTDDPANHADCLKQLNDDGPYPEPRWGQDGE